MTAAPDSAAPVHAVVNRDGGSDVILVCEHASNDFPARFGTLGLGDQERRAHIAWDPGALGLALGLSARLDACLVHATVSRLIYDLNRPPHAAGAMPAKSEVYDIPGNAAISPAERLARTQAIYLPFHDILHAEVARRLAQGRAPVIITVHSFTPIYFGRRRDVQLGVIHDQDPDFARSILNAARATSSLDCRLNEPYSATDGVTHTLRLQATPYGLRNAMLEIRNDLIATIEGQAAIGEILAGVLVSACRQLVSAREAR